MQIVIEGKSVHVCLSSTEYNSSTSNDEAFAVDSQSMLSQSTCIDIPYIIFYILSRKYMPTDAKECVHTGTMIPVRSSPPDNCP